LCNEYCRYVILECLIILLDLGFIPAPIVFGAIIDQSCSVWHSLCPEQKGNCILYDNEAFKYSYHLSNAGFQFIAIASVAFTFYKARTFVFPEEEPFDHDRMDPEGEHYFDSKKPTSV
jgi:hypothetical protein